MKHLLISALTVAILGSVAGVNTASAQAKPADPAHKVGLIDMGHVFQEYAKFKKLREGLQSEIQKSDAQAKQYLDKSQNLQKKIKTFQQGSTQYAQIEKQLLEVKAQFEAFRAGAQRDLMRKESQIYKQCYVDVSKAVGEYAKYYNYTLIMRFNRKDVTESEAPGEIVNSMNRQVIWHRPKDDITDSVLNYLNKQYGQTAQGPGTTRTR